MAEQIYYLKDAIQYPNLQYEDVKLTLQGCIRGYLRFVIAKGQTHEIVTVHQFGPRKAYQNSFVMEWEELEGVLSRLHSKVRTVKPEDREAKILP
jgi:hypothetical protein